METSFSVEINETVGDSVRIQDALVVFQIVVSATNLALIGCQRIGETVGNVVDSFDTVLGLLGDIIVFDALDAGEAFVFAHIVL